MFKLSKRQEIFLEKNELTKNSFISLVSSLTSKKFFSFFNEEFNLKNCLIICEESSLSIDFLKNLSKLAPLHCDALLKSALPNSLLNKENEQSFLDICKQTPLPTGWNDYSIALNRWRDRKSERAKAIRRCAELATAVFNVDNFELSSISELQICEMVTAECAENREKLFEKYFPLIEKLGKIQTDEFNIESLYTSEELRSIDERLKRKQIRRKAKTARQHISMILKTCGGRTNSKYCDDYSLLRLLERDKLNKEFLSKMVYLSQDEETAITMQEIAEKKQSSDIFRISCMSKGIDDLMNEKGFQAIFITMTLPGKYHPNPAFLNANNEAYSPDITPQETDRQLKWRWEKFRARLHKAKIDNIGMKVIEPHSDGCPHLHALLYVANEEAIQAVDNILTDICPEPEIAPVDDLGRPKRVASKLVTIDRDRGSPCTYVMKYIRKTLSKPLENSEILTVQNDDEDDHLSDNFDRVRAYASERNLRRFSFLGVHGIQKIWQRIFTASEFEINQAPAQIKKVKIFMEEKKYSDALKEMNALKIFDCDEDLKDNDRIRLGYEEATNRFKEVVKKPTFLRIENNDNWRLEISRGGRITKELAKDGYLDDDFNFVEFENQSTRYEEEKVLTENDLTLEDYMHRLEPDYLEDLQDLEDNFKKVTVVVSYPSLSQARNQKDTHYKGFIRDCLIEIKSCNKFLEDYQNEASKQHEITETQFQLAELWKGLGFELKKEEIQEDSWCYA